MKRNDAKYIAAESDLRRYIKYDAESGVFTWLDRPPYSSVRVGDVAGYRSNANIVVKLRGRLLYAHVVAWWFVTGEWPKNEVDHKNVDGFDNRFENLRRATRTQNACNRRASSKTGAGLKGAFTQDGRWLGQIVVGGRQIYLGRFDTEEAAHAAYTAASRKYHGEFSRTE